MRWLRAVGPVDGKRRAAEDSHARSLRTMATRPLVSRYKFVETDIDQVRASMPKTRTCVRLNPIGDTSVLSIEGCQFSVPGFDIWRTGCQTGIEARFAEPPDVYALYLPVDGVMEVSCRGKQLVSNSGRLIVSELARTDLTRKHGGRSHIGITFDRNSVRRQLSELLDAQIGPDIDLALEVESGSRTYEQLMSLGNLLWTMLSKDSEEELSPHTTVQLFKTILVTMLDSFPHRYSAALAGPDSTATPRHVKRAIDFMVENLGRPLEMQDLAREAGVSERALQAAFRQFKDKTPLQYLRDLRLNALRRDLIDGKGESIAELARRQGFNHMGRLSGLYREAFGEFPTETFRRHRKLP